MWVLRESICIYIHIHVHYIYIYIQTLLYIFSFTYRSISILVNRFKVGRKIKIPCCSIPLVHITPNSPAQQVCTCRRVSKANAGSSYCKRIECEAKKAKQTLPLNLPFAHLHAGLSRRWSLIYYQCRVAVGSSSDAGSSRVRCRCKCRQRRAWTKTKTKTG